MKKYLAIALLAFAPLSFAQTITSSCPTGSTTCTASTQNVGDISNPSTAQNTTSTSSQAGNSSNSIASGTTINPDFDNRSQTTQNANNTTTGTISGGNTTSGATGGAATGNLSSNDNKSSVGNTSASTGASTSNSGGNTLGGATSSSGGNITGGNTVAGGNNTASTGDNKNTNSVTGGNTSSTSQGGKGGDGGNSVATGGAGGKSASTSSSNGTNAQGQGQGQGQSSQNAVVGGAQTNGQSSSNKVGNTSSNGQGQSSTTKSSQDASTRSGSDVATNVDASDRSSTKVEGDKTFFFPAVTPPTPASFVATGNIIKETLACGPRQRVIKTPIDGTYFGFFKTKKIEQGTTDELASEVDSDGQIVTYKYAVLPNGDVRVLGTQPVIISTVVGISGARSFGMGGNGNSGASGQIAGGASASMNQLVTRIIVSDCDVGSLRGREAEQIRLQLQRKRNGG